MNEQRQICLDTETTGLRPDKGDRVIEIGAVEIIDRQLSDRHFHGYFNPQVDSIDAKAVAVHGLTAEFLQDKPLFEERCQEFLEFIADAELIMHNAPFDAGFLNAEMKRVKSIGAKTLEQSCAGVTDTLTMAQSMRPGQGNSLDDLRKHYRISDARELHGALVDARILAKVYLMMTSGQDLLSLDSATSPRTRERADLSQYKLTRLPAEPDAVRLHEYLMEKIKAGSEIVEQDFQPR